MSETETDESSERPAAPKRRGRVKKKHTVGYVVLASLVTLALVTALSIVFLYRHLNGNLNVQDVTNALGDDRPVKVASGPQEPLNVLVMGSDTRDCDGCALDDEAGGDASDTTILLHLSADRKRAYGVSIPRDSIVDRPDCGDKDQIPGGEDVLWNAAYTVGDQACTIRQFEELTGVFVDHYVVVNFGGFKSMVNAIDGVSVCIPEDIVDPKHGINIEAGKSRVLRDAEALNYVRARYTLGDGSDISRIKRQQAFIASMVNKLVSKGTLTRVDRIVGFLNAATSSLTVDPGLENVAKIGKLGLQFQDIGLDKIQFLTIPNAYYPTDSEFSGRVYWTPEAKRVWARIASDQPLSRRLTTGAISAAAPPGAEPSPGQPSDTASPGDSSSPSETPSETEPPTDDEVAAAEDNGLCA
ncbi:MAG: LCP family protein [Nocardioides sp.]|nr:LCP family protein [Nocardioides sp.]